MNVSQASRESTSERSKATRTVVRVGVVLSVLAAMFGALTTTDAGAATAKKAATKKAAIKSATTRKPAPTTVGRDSNIVLQPVNTLGPAAVPPSSAPPAVTTTVAPSTTVAPDFEIRVAQPNQTVGRNEVASYNLFVDPGSGYAGSVILAISDLPPGTEAVYEPIPITTVGQVRIRTTDRTPNGTFIVKVIASTPRSSRTTSLVLTVVDGATSTTTTTSTSTTSTSTTTTIGTKTFVLQINQIGQEIAPGKTIRADVSIIPSGGFNEPLVLSVAGAPQGTSANFVKSPISIAETGQLFISAAANANNLVAGTATVAISATGGGVTRTASITFTVRTTA